VYFTVKKSNQHEKCEQEEAWCDANTSGIWILQILKIYDKAREIHLKNKT
jgi:hypothetical protein